MAKVKTPPRPHLVEFWLDESEHFQLAGERSSVSEYQLTEIGRELDDIYQRYLIDFERQPLAVAGESQTSVYFWDSGIFRIPAFTSRRGTFDLSTNAV